jgi:hypothetical protein
MRKDDGPGLTVGRVAGLQKDTCISDTAFHTCTPRYSDHGSMCGGSRANRRFGVLIVALPIARRMCPHCGDVLRRVRRVLADRLLSIVVPLRRYECYGPGCGWRGVIRVHSRGCWDTDATPPKLGRLVRAVDVECRQLAFRYGTLDSDNSPEQPDINEQVVRLPEARARTPAVDEESGQTQMHEQIDSEPIRDARVA